MKRRAIEPVLTRRQVLENRLVAACSLLSDDELEKAVLHAERMEDRFIQKFVADIEHKRETLRQFKTSKS